MFILEQYGEYVREWWADKVQERPQVDATKLTWVNLLSHWDTVETDFHHFYSIDFGSGVLTNRRWRWFRIRLIRLLAEDTALARELGLRTTPSLKE
ncbi:hypothetical protein HMPREF2998_00510 [Corynebacterium sp. HMSC065A05]|uniref:hypothetical protein n=1 Tax=Corynebacterium sp. HMSC065A05 TaxID=1739502 RepID=UPI0008ADE676|nr:hypothetical protein [Corynebacterium sp. HMSC065A05]OFP16000.1 hypothetical protein HMPREF2998_00510 [Corynebacterium sp. HMSC065A05]